MRHPLALRLSRHALISNYQALQRRAGCAAGAAIKADAYGLGVSAVARTLLEEGCRDFFVSTWAETEDLDFLPDNSLAVLHGFAADDEPRMGIRPVLVTLEQVGRWKGSSWGDQPSDVMIDTGMNRLGLRLQDVDCLHGLKIHTLHSHLACADENHPLNDLQLRRFRELRDCIEAQRYSLANSAGIYLGKDYAFDLVRPGLALYGGIPRSEAREEIQQVAVPAAHVIQLRDVPAGESVGYNATFTAPRETRIAVINIGYADGYRRAFSSLGSAQFEGVELPVVGRVSMDLVTLDATEAGDIREGDWVTLDFDLENAASQSGISQYELLTGLGRRFERSWL